MKDEFLATLSHELRTPLSAILGWSQLLSSGSMERDEVKEGLETIERNARVQTQLIEDLLDMNRIVSGKVRLDVQRMDLADVVEAAVNSIRPGSGSQGDSPTERLSIRWRVQSLVIPVDCSKLYGTCCPMR